MRTGETSSTTIIIYPLCQDGGKPLLPPTLFKAKQSFAGHIRITCSTEHHKYILIVLLCTIVCKACSTEQSFLVKHLILILEEDVITSII